jgi:hypothetical protein
MRDPQVLQAPVPLTIASALTKNERLQVLQRAGTKCMVSPNQTCARRSKPDEVERLT